MVNGATLERIFFSILRCATLQEVSEEAIEQVKTNLHVAIQTAPDWGKAWHSWALFNAQMLEYYARTDVVKAQCHVAPAVAGFFKSVALGQAIGGEHVTRHMDESALLNALASHRRRDHV